MRLGNKCGCHQREDRSFKFNGWQFPICSRCTGILTGQIIGIIIYNKGTIVGYKRNTYYLEHSYTHIILGTILVIIDIIYLLLSVKEYKFKKKNQEYNHKIQKKHLFSGRKIEHIVNSSVFIVMLLYLFQYFIKNFDGINYTDVVKVFIN